MTDNGEYSIILNGVSKIFEREYAKKDTMLARILAFVFNVNERKKFYALQDISFKAHAGENIGVIGDNGSGKSTLLRIIAGIYKQSSGEVVTEQEVLYVSGFASGAKPKLTMRENIYLTGALMGFSKKQVGDLIDRIIEFSDLEEYVDTKICHFSSGMLSRFSYSSTIHFIRHKNPGILLLDDVFSAGADIGFKEKSLNRMEEFVQGGATVLLAGHNLSMVAHYCHRVIWIKKGKIMVQGAPADVIREYENDALQKKILQKRRSTL